MNDTIKSFTIYRLTTPLGRMIGDNNCSYNQIDILALALHTREGRTGWGYTEAIWNGSFTRTAWYIRQLPSLAELNIQFENSWWAMLMNRDPNTLSHLREHFRTRYHYFDAAVRLALWDIMAQLADLPLYRLLGADGSSNKVEAYGSPLDFPLSDEETVLIVQDFVSNGFKTIKVKLGSPDPQRDVDRLKLVKQAAGKEITLNADANEAWDWETVIDRLELFEKNGIALEYIEDPLPRDDFKGLSELTKRSPIPVVGHDYVNDADIIRRMVEERGLKGIRTGKDMDYIKACALLGRKFNVPLYLVNSLFEVNVHAGVAFSEVKRIEFSALKHNDMMKHPVRFENGYAIAPELPGHGLFPDIDKLKEFASDFVHEKFAI